MCGRYTLTNPKKIPERFNTANELPLYDASFNIPPATRNPIVYRRSPTSVQLAKWGLIPFWARDPKIAYSTINARAEDIAQKPVFRKPIKSQRCLVPADGFIEWKRVNLEGTEEKLPYYIHLKDHSLFAFAGLWDTWKDAEGVETLTYSIITTTPNELMTGLHHRMPVILHQADEEAWLDNETPLSMVLDLLRPYPANEMVSYSVSTRVNNPQNDDPTLLQLVELGQPLL